MGSDLVTDWLMTYFGDWNGPHLEESEVPHSTPTPGCFIENTQVDVKYSSITDFPQSECSRRGIQSAAVRRAVVVKGWNKKPIRKHTFSFSQVSAGAWLYFQNPIKINLMLATLSICGFGRLVYFLLVLRVYFIILLLCRCCFRCVGWLMIKLF